MGLASSSLQVSLQFVACASPRWYSGFVLDSQVESSSCLRLENVSLKEEFVQQRRQVAEAVIFSAGWVMTAGTLDLRRTRDSQSKGCEPGLGYPPMMGLPKPHRERFSLFGSCVEPQKPALAQWQQEWMCSFFSLTEDLSLETD